jgi:hypothetical protein
MADEDDLDNPDFEVNPLWYYLQRARENNTDVTCLRCTGPLTRAERARDASWCARCEKGAETSPEEQVMTHPAISMVTEEPTREPVNTGDIYTARLTPGTPLPRWTVFRDGRFTPVGYLEAVYDPRENTWGLVVTDGNLQRIGTHGKRDNPDVPPHVTSYHNALAWLMWREKGIA